MTGGAELEPEDQHPQPLKCIRCHGQLQVGYIPQSTESGLRQLNWCPGAPQRSFWTGLKVKKGTALTVITYRCVNCGYLESYASPNT